MSEQNDANPTATEQDKWQPKLRWRQFSLRMLLLVTLVASLLVGWIAADFRNVERRRLAHERLLWDLKTYGGDRSFPWYSSWFYKLRGDEEPYDFTFLVFNNFGIVNDSTLETVANFDSLEQLWINGRDISITDAGLEHIKGLKRLRDLSLADAPVTAGAVESLQRSLPDCDISWNPPKVGD